MLAVLLALLAAALLGLGTVLLQRGTLQTTANAADARFYLQILRRPVWLLGVAVTVAGGLLHLLALAAGPLTVIQPVLTLSLVFALAFGVVLTGQRLGLRELTGSGVAVAGLVVFLRVADRTGGTPKASTTAWLLGTGAVAAAVAVTTLAARRRRPAVAGGLLGLAAGACFGLVAALLKAVTSDVGLSGGAPSPASVLRHPAVYAALLAGLAGWIAQQAALRSGARPPAVTANTLAGLAVSVLLGILVLGETITGAHTTPIVATGAGLVGVAALFVAASGLVLLMHGQSEIQGWSVGGP